MHFFLGFLLAVACRAQEPAQNLEPARPRVSSVEIKRPSKKPARKPASKSKPKLKGAKPPVQTAIPAPAPQAAASTAAAPSPWPAVPVTPIEPNNP
ncbi:MAG: hypothetical protein HY549_04035 [Elusimicrobia bacterium]|nr:hypothetical protein [Elusimicrobiota bacterium]